MSLNDANAEINRARMPRAMNPEVQLAINDLLEAKKNSDDIKEELKALQAKSEAAEKSLGECVLKFKEFCPESR